MNWLKDKKKYLDHINKIKSFWKITNLSILSAKKILVRYNYSIDDACKSLKDPNILKEFLNKKKVIVDQIDWWGRTVFANTWYSKLNDQCLNITYLTKFVSKTQQALSNKIFENTLNERVISPALNIIKDAIYRFIIGVQKYTKIATSFNQHSHFTFVDHLHDLNIDWWNRINSALKDDQFSDNTSNKIFIKQYVYKHKLLSTLKDDESFMTLIMKKFKLKKVDRSMLDMNCNLINIFISSLWSFLMQYSIILLAQVYLDDVDDMLSFVQLLIDLNERILNQAFYDKVWCMILEFDKLVSMINEGIMIKTLFLNVSLSKGIWNLLRTNSMQHFQRKRALIMTFYDHQNNHLYDRKIINRLMSELITLSPSCFIESKYLTIESDEGGTFKDIFKRYRLIVKKIFIVVR